jgi:hypothetical protein
MPVRRRALELLASSRHDVNAELLVHGHGVSQRVLADIVRVGLAASERRVMKVGGKTIEVVWLLITAAGRRAIEK